MTPIEELSIRMRLLGCETEIIRQPTHLTDGIIAVIPSHKLKDSFNGFATGAFALISREDDDWMRMNNRAKRLGELAAELQAMMT